MKKTLRLFKFRPAIATVTLFLSACVTQAPPPLPAPASEAAPTPAPVQVPQEAPEKAAERAARTAAQAELDSGVALYTNGDFRAAIKRFGTMQDTLKPYKDLQLSALKYTAFSYCVTGHAPMCKQEFEKAFKLDPHFDLEPGEKGHPLWGPVFERARKDAH